MLILQKIHKRVMTRAIKIIKQYMKEMGVTQQELAYKIGIHPVTLNRNLKKGNFSQKTLQALSYIFAEWENKPLSVDVSRAMKNMEIKGEINLMSECVKINNYEDIKRLNDNLDKINKILEKIKIDSTNPENQKVFLDLTFFNCSSISTLDVKDIDTWKKLFNNDLVFRQVLLNPCFYGKNFEITCIPYYLLESLNLPDSLSALLETEIRNYTFEKIGRLLTQLRNNKLKENK